MQRPRPCAKLPPPAANERPRPKHATALYPEGTVRGWHLASHSVRMRVWRLASLLEPSLLLLEAIPKTCQASVLPFYLASFVEHSFIGNPSCLSEASAAGVRQRSQPEACVLANAGSFGNGIANSIFVLYTSHTLRQLSFETGQNFTFQDLYVPASHLRQSSAADMHRDGSLERVTQAGSGLEIRGKF